MTSLDELLQSRVNQLRDIDDRLERIQKTLLGLGKPVFVILNDTAKNIASLRADILLAIQQAEREHAEF